MGIDLLNHLMSGIFHCSASSSSAAEFITLWVLYLSQPAITCSKLTIETLEQGVKYVQS